LINNADRKGSHILIDPDDHIWLIDHGVCFHVEDKLRTVVWDFAGESLPDALCSDLIRFRERLGINDSRFGRSGSQLASDLSNYISRDEIRALDQRAQRIVSTNEFPPPNPYRRPYPWPQI
jgi:uncharacterized repeat protein (TIGR03843 family)